MKNIEFENYSFQPYERKRPSGSGKAMVVISPSGLITVGAKACEDLEIQDYKYARLLYDSNKRAVAISFSKKPAKGNFNLSRRANRRSTSIQGKQFFNDIKINPSDYAGEYDYSTISHKGSLFIVVNLIPRS